MNGQKMKDAIAQAVGDYNLEEREADLLVGRILGIVKVLSYPLRDMKDAPMDGTKVDLYAYVGDGDPFRITAAYYSGGEWFFSGFSIQRLCEESLSKAINLIGWAPILQVKK